MRKYLLLADLTLSFILPFKINSIFQLLTKKFSSFACLHSPNILFLFFLSSFLFKIGSIEEHVTSNMHISSGKLEPVGATCRTLLHTCQK